MKETLLKYFPDISDEQISKFSQLEVLLKEWNQKINLISRKDTDNIFIHHILHSLAIASYIDFAPNSSIMDLGSGGGLPGIPLAIMFPDSFFTLVDRTGKKMTAAQEIADSINLKNVKAVKADANEIQDKFDFIVSRGVMPLPDLIKIAKKKIKDKKDNEFHGLIALKGGELDSEIKGIKNPLVIKDIKEFFNEEYFDTKKVIYVGI